jgi:hypothetical protein
MPFREHRSAWKLAGCVRNGQLGPGAGDLWMPRQLARRMVRHPAPGPGRRRTRPASAPSAARSAATRRSGFARHAGSATPTGPSSRAPASRPAWQSCQNGSAGSSPTWPASAYSPGQACQLVTQLGRLLADGGPGHPQALLERARFLHRDCGKGDWAPADVHDIEAFLATLPRVRKRRRRAAVLLAGRRGPWAWSQRASFRAGVASLDGPGTGAGAAGRLP